MLRLGVVPFLNVKPLVFPLEQNLVPHDFEIVYAPPSELSLMMKRGSIDVGLLPVAELIESTPYVVVPGMSISSFGKVGSVVLVSTVPLSKISSVAVDGRSQSSSSLLRVVLELFNNASPRYVSRLPDEGGFLDGVDAGMYIGNTGLVLSRRPPKGYDVHDLGELWTAETGLPFVYAIYAVRGGVKLGGGLDTLMRAKEAGVGLAEKIAIMEAPRMGLSEEVCMEYLTERIRYDLGERELLGVAAYAGYLHELGLAAAASFGLELYVE